MVMDIERLVALGKTLGLDGERLHNFVKEQKEEEKNEKVERERVARDERAHQLKIRKQDKELLELQLKLKDVKQEGGVGGISEDQAHNFMFPKLPPFEDSRDDIDAYLQRFERYATNLKWHKHSWAINLSALLKGKALEVYSRLSASDAADYSVLKIALLKRYQLTEHGFQQRFRTAVPEKDESPSQFVVRMDNVLTRWIDMAPDSAIS